MENSANFPYIQKFYKKFSMPRNFINFEGPKNKVFEVEETHSIQKHSVFERF